MNYLWLLSDTLRLFTSPRDWSYYDILSSTQAYEKLMKNNVDLELSFNTWDISIQKALNTSKGAIFADASFLYWGQSYSKDARELSCLVILSYVLYRKRICINIIK